MNNIPQHTRLMIERLLDAYCTRICPLLARNTVLIGYRIDADQVVIHELRRILGVPGTCEPVPVARFRHRPAGNDWALDFFDGSTWRRYRPLPASRGFIELLREFDRDPEGLFWGHLDGKSLRWCSARGRCAGCDLRYRQVLGVAVDSAAPDAAPSTRANVAALSARSIRR